MNESGEIWYHVTGLCKWDSFWSTLSVWGLMADLMRWHEVREKKLMWWTPNSYTVLILNSAQVLIDLLLLWLLKTRKCHAKSVSPKEIFMKPKMASKPPQRPSTLFLLSPPMMTHNDSEHTALSSINSAHSRAARSLQLPITQSPLISLWMLDLMEICKDFSI